MKKTLLILLIIIILVVLGYIGSQWVLYGCPGCGVHEQPAPATYYSCDGDGLGGQTGFTVDKGRDGQFHVTIPSKPPQTDLIVNRNFISGGSEYHGNGIYIKDSENGLQINFNGKALQNCRQVYSGV